MARHTSESSVGPWWKLLLLIIDKVVLVVITAAAITCFQSKMKLSQERLEKAKHIAEISADKPVTIVAELPAHLDAFILYAEHIRSRDVEISSERLTDLQARISSDIEGSRAYYDSDQRLTSWANTIKTTVSAIRAIALIKGTLRPEDLSALEKARAIAYKFHGRVIELSVQKSVERFDTFYKAH